MTRTFVDTSNTNEYYNYQVKNKYFYRTPPHHVIQVREKFSCDFNYGKPQNYSAHRRKRNADKIDDYYYRAMGPIIRFGQFITLMPIVNCLDADRRKIKFKWLSFQTLKTVIGVSCTIFDFGLLLRLVRRVPRFSVNIVWAIVFDICGCMAHILLFRIAMNWHHLIRKWSWRESTFLRPPYKKLKYSLKLQLRLIAFLMLLVAIVEHVLFLTQIIYPVHRRNEICGYNRNVLKQLYMGLKAPYAVLFDYSIYMLLLSEWINFTMTLGWTYVDVLIVTMCVALNSRYEQINLRMQSLKSRPFNEQTWNEIREQYMRLTEIISYINRYFGSAILLSCTSNMYFICQQLYNSVKIDFDFPINRIYFWFSLTFVMAKTFTVLFSASRINDTSLKSLSILREISLIMWSVEIERFMEVLFSDSVSLTGLNYFNVTRRFMFAMVGTIITYEILLFDEVVLEIKRGSISNLCK